MATMPSRHDTFDEALESIIRQVDRLYLYLDGHDRVPEAVRKHSNIVPILSRDEPGLHANGKLLGLVLEPSPCLYVAVDDDLYYRRDFVHGLRRSLVEYGDRAVVGLHGSMLARPLIRYNQDRHRLAYSDRLRQSCQVDVLGTGAVLFSSDLLKFDVRNWSFYNMVDLGFAIEAAKAGLPLMCVARRKNRVIMLRSSQPDSIFVSVQRDDTRQTALAHELLRLTGSA